jgi:hypothetical protein
MPQQREKTSGVEAYLYLRDHTTKKNLTYLQVNHCRTKMSPNRVETDK